MTSTAFTYWVHGWSEINGGGAPSDQQWQIILDHLALVNHTSAADAARSASVPIQIARTEHTPIFFTGLSDTIQIRSGDSVSTYSWADMLRKDNADKVFITVSREPIYDLTARYSYYPYIQSYWNGRGNVTDLNTRAFLTGHGVQPVGDKVYVVIDNSLYPSTGTYARNMYASSSHHLHGLHPSAPGIINIGTYSPAYC